MKVRRAGEGDARRIAEIHVRSWRAAYRGILPDAVLERLSVSEREQMWNALLREEGNRRLTLVTEGLGEAAHRPRDHLEPERELGVVGHHLRRERVAVGLIEPRLWAVGTLMGTEGLALPLIEVPIG